MEIENILKHKIFCEVGVAHGGDANLAIEFIEMLGPLDAAIPKFQCHIAAHESTLDEPFRVPISGFKSRYEYWRAVEFMQEEWHSIAKTVRKFNKPFISSVFSVESVKMLRQVGIDFIKIPSGETRNYELLDEIFINGDEPILLSTGLITIEELHQLKLRYSSHWHRLALFHCVSKYPTPLDKLRLGRIRKLKSEFNVPIGYSDHSGEVSVAFSSMLFGATFIEVHVKCGWNFPNPDLDASLNFDEVTRIANIFAECGQSDFVEMEDEEFYEYRELFGRSVAAKTFLPAGSIIRRSDVHGKKPAGFIPMEQVETVVGKKCKVDLQPNRAIRLQDLEG